MKTFCNIIKFSRCRILKSFVSLQIYVDEDSDDDGCNLRTTIVEQQLKKFGHIELVLIFIILKCLVPI